MTRSTIQGDLGQRRDGEGDARREAIGGAASYSRPEPRYVFWQDSLGGGLKRIALPEPAWMAFGPVRQE
jgi:hypothetical protein